MTLFNETLGGLSDPLLYQDPINIDGENDARLVENLRLMWVIRKAEEKIADEIIAGNIKCPCHLGIGQEAVAVGLSEYLKPSDKVFGAHRSHSHFLGLGGKLTGLFAEVLGKVTGCSKGMGGSMHLYDPSIGFHGSVPIVGGSVPIATGAGLAAKLSKKGDVAVSYFGDGAIEEGAVQESLNLASVMKLPVIFVCENNLFSSHLHIDLRQPNNSVARFAKASLIKNYTIDGNDIVTVKKVSKEAIDFARAGNGPIFIEAVTYRWRGHVGPSEDTDVGVKRGVELAVWRNRDPIARLATSLIQANILTNETYRELMISVDDDIKAAWQKAMNDPYPEISALMETVYAN
jgi:pyruvate dehydrogenase E1 component alpha subunit